MSQQYEKIYAFCMCSDTIRCLQFFNNLSTIGFAVGFVLMMILDVVLG